MRRLRYLAQHHYREMHFAIYKFKCMIMGSILYIDYMVLVVGQACNYKCLDCANFCPSAPEDYKRYTLDSITENLDILLKYARIEKLQIQGGEPFVYSELKELLKYINEHRSRIHNVEIATNGSIIPTDSLMEIIKECNASIRISNYGKSLASIEKLRAKCDRYGVDYHLYGFASGESLWFQCGRADIGKQTELSTTKFKNCMFNRCLTLERGELSRCSRAANSYHIQNFERKERDYVRIEDSKQFKNKLREYLLEPKPMEACNYCFGTSPDNMIPAARQPGE